MGRRFRGCHVARSDLDSIGSQHQGGCNGLAAADSTGRHQRNVDGSAHRWYQAEGGGFFAAVVTPRLKAFGNDGVHPCLLGFDGKAGAGHDMKDFAALIVEVGGPFGGATGRSNHHRNLEFGQKAQVIFNLRVQKGQIHCKRPIANLLHAFQLPPKLFGAHGSGPKGAQTTGHADRGGQFPATAPDHSGLDEG